MQACHCFPFNTIYAANMLNTRKQNVNRRVFFSLSAQKSRAKKDCICTCNFLFCDWLHGNLHKSGPSILDYRTDFRNWKDVDDPTKTLTKMYKMYKSMFGSIVFYPCDQILFIARTVSSPQNEWAKCGIAQAEIEKCVGDRRSPTGHVGTRGLKKLATSGRGEPARYPN